MHIYGCWFHLGQCLYRHVVGELRVLYNTDGNFALEVRMVGALAFVPLAQVSEHFEALVLQVDQRLMPFCEYFEANFIGEGASINVVFLTGEGGWGGGYFLVFFCPL